MQQTLAAPVNRKSLVSQGCRFHMQASNTSHLSAQGKQVADSQLCRGEQQKLSLCWKQKESTQQTMACSI